jgi:hypothetical protein
VQEEVYFYGFYGWITKEEKEKYLRTDPRFPKR